MTNLITRDLSYYIEIISRKDNEYYFDEIKCNDKLIALENAGVKKFGVDGIPANIDSSVIQTVLILSLTGRQKRTCKSLHFTMPDQPMMSPTRHRT